MKELDVRARLLAALEADLVGPFAAGDPTANPEDVARSDETLTLPPSRWYLTGFLAPRGARAPEADDLDSHGGELAAGSESQADDAGSEEPEPKRPVRFAASMGLSVYLRAARGADGIEVEVLYAYYDKVEVGSSARRMNATNGGRAPGERRSSGPRGHSPGGLGVSGGAASWCSGGWNRFGSQRSCGRCLPMSGRW